MSINFELLDAAIADAANEAGGIQHHQLDWLSFRGGAEVVETREVANACGTATCLAGFIALRSGAVPPTPVESVGAGWVLPEWYLDAETGVCNAAGTHVSEYAEAKAGLSEDQADALFEGSNSLDGIRAMVDHLREHPEADYEALRVVLRKAVATNA